ncbi:PAS domain-containing protein [Azohydromonas sediminis]|uniref:PAS domain-containing protein n=1 Tax=Azohydromonas sediminis TaxID=2259674 RepID=UPI000E651365|nr:PAS domain-containing protein [Azohydromonas sediminis]
MSVAAAPIPSRLSAANMAALLDAVADAVLVFDSRGQVYHANLAARQLGVPESARTLDDLAALFGADALAWVHRLRGTAPPQPVTQLARLGDGRVVTLELSRLPGGPWALLVRPLAAGGAAPSAGDHAVDELVLWFDLSPVGMVMLDAEGLVVRSNRAFEALVGRVPVTMADADAPLRELLAWDDDARPLGAAIVERHATLVQPDGSRRRVAARLRAIEPLPGQRRLLAVVEDRSAEDERDLAQLEIGALMDTAGIGVATFDESRGWLRSRAPRVTPGEAPAGGASVEGLQAISRELVDPASLPEYERLQRALKAGERVQVRYAVRHPALGRRWLLTRVEPGRLASGRRTMSVVTLDVTEQERSREQLLLQAERTRAILDSVLVGIVTVRDGGIEWMNRSARRMFGGELADFAGAPIATVATPEPDHPLRRDDWVAVLAEGQAETFECRLKARDGREYWVVGNVVATGGELTFALLDIDARRQAELRVAQAQASLERIIETAPMAIGLVDAASLRVLQLNQMAAAFIGTPIDAAVGRRIDELFGSDDGAQLRDDLREALASDAVTRREYRRRGAGGAARVWDARYVPLRGPADADPGCGQLLLAASDVTEQRAAEATQRDVLVREVHHRIKNNLQGVAGLMQQIAERRPEVAPVIKEAVGQVQAIAQVYGLQVGASGPLRIKSVLDAIAASVQRMFGRPIAVEVQGGAPHRWALPDAESIPIALTVNELLTNAVKHGAADLVRCTLDCSDDAVRIVVANRGRLAPGFDFAQVRGGVSGLGLVRALLPRRHAALAIEAVGDEVHARVTLTPPVVTLLEPL